MAITTGVSTLGQSNTQIARLGELQKSMSELQRQLTTQKKHDDYSGFGFESLSLQRSRMEKGHLESYLSNIDNVTTRVKLMSTSLTKVSDIGRQLIESIQSEVRTGNVDVNTMRTLARDALNFFKDVTNTEIDGRYLFSGSSTTTQPINSLNNTNADFQAQITNWLNGTTSTAQLMTDVNAMTTTQLGFDPSLSSSGEVSLRIDDATEVDYTVMGNSNGFDDIMRALGLMANLQAPNPATDTPTNDELNDVLDGILVIAQRGVDAVDAASTMLGSKFNMINSVQEQHEQDLALYENAIAETENADTTEIVAKIQSLQTQLSASYQVTNIVSQLSLINFLS